MKVLLFALAFILILPVCAQHHYIKKAFAFYQRINSGAPPVYKNGIATSRSQTKEFIYLEISGNTKPKITEVAYKGILYSDVDVYPAGLEKLNAGIEKATGKIVVLRPAKGNSLWRLEFVVNEIPGDHLPSRENKILIKGEKGGRPFSVKIDEEKELKPLIGY